MSKIDKVLLSVALAALLGNPLKAQTGGVFGTNPGKPWYRQCVVGSDWPGRSTCPALPVPSSRHPARAEPHACPDHQFGHFGQPDANASSKSAKSAGSSVSARSGEPKRTVQLLKPPQQLHPKLRQPGHEYCQRPLDPATDQSLPAGSAPISRFGCLQQPECAESTEPHQGPDQPASEPRFASGDTRRILSQSDPRFFESSSVPGLPGDSGPTVPIPCGL